MLATFETAPRTPDRIPPPPPRRPSSCEPPSPVLLSKVTGMKDGLLSLEPQLDTAVPGKAGVVRVASWEKQQQQEQQDVHS